MRKFALGLGCLLSGLAATPASATWSIVAADPNDPIAGKGGDDPGADAPRKEYFLYIDVAPDTRPATLGQNPVRMLRKRFDAWKACERP